MNIEKIKMLIENKQLGDELIIFESQNAPFIARQYIKEISNFKSKPIKYFESLDDYFKDTFVALGLFKESDTLNVINCAKIKSLPERCVKCQNLIINASVIDNQLKETYKEYIVEIPKLQNWQIENYIFNQGEGVPVSSLEHLIKRCAFNIDLLDNEISKISIFEPAQRPYIFNELEDAHLLERGGEYSIFSLTNAIQSRDLMTVCEILKEISRIDVEPLGLVTLLYTNFKKIINVWLTPNPTENNTGLKSNQIWAIKNLPRNYTKNQLIVIFKELTLLEYKLKQGLIPEDLLIDYVIVKVFSIK